MNSEHAGLVIAVTGDNTIDRYLGPPDSVLVGGNALNVAVQLHRHGRATRYYGVVGRDRAADRIRGEVLAQGLEDRGLREVAGETAETVVEIGADGDRFFSKEDFGVTADYLPTETELDEMARSAWVHIGMTGRATELRSALAERGQTAVSQDCAVSDGFDHLAVAFLSAGDDPLQASARAAAAVAAGAGIAVATAGAHGATATDGRSTWHVPADPTTVVDTTGAGDSFIAGFVAARLLGADVPTCLRQGASWAAATCRHIAGFPQG